MEYEGYENGYEQAADEWPEGGDGYGYGEGEEYYDENAEYEAPKNIEHGLSNALENEQIAEGKYLCARCGSEDTTVECRTCRRIYCKSCADHLHGAGAYQDHKLRAFDPQYEAYKRAVKRGTKFDSNAPSPAVLAPGEQIGNMPNQSKVALVLLIVAFILCVISIGLPGWTYCSQRNPSWKIGQWTRCSTAGECDGTLYLFQTLPCTHRWFKVPVNASRALMIGALFFTFQGMVLTLIAQKAIWRSLVMLKAAGVSSFVAAVLYIVATSVWMFSILHDVPCPITSGGPDGLPATMLKPICPYGPAGWCNFNYGFYFAYICMFIVILAGALLFDWWRGLPWMAIICKFLLSLVLMLALISLISGYWVTGYRYIQGTNDYRNTWAGLWRACHKCDKGYIDGYYDADHFCTALGSWTALPNSPVDTITLQFRPQWFGCMNKGKYHAIRGLLITGLLLGSGAYLTIFYAHAFRKPGACKVGCGMAALMWLFFLVDIILFPIMANSSHSCDLGHGLGTTSYPKLPICGDKCSLSWGYWLLLIATILGIGVIIMMLMMRVGFEQWEYLDQDGKQITQKPERVKAEKDVIWLDDGQSAPAGATVYQY